MLGPSTRIGRYEIKSSLGKGGMGSLYLARDPNTDRLVALKLLAAHLDSDELKARFELEAKALAQLNHPNIVDIYDSGQYRGTPFIVMEYVRGETLDEMIRRRAPLSQSRKLKLIAQLCAGLGHAHEVGVIHRDVKPANLMVADRSQRLKIVDFGIARMTEGLTRFGKMTRVNTQIGTPGYMSPEQIDGGTLDHRSDLFAVGVVLYELLTNTTAFPGASTRQIERKVLEEQPPVLDTLVPDLDPAIQVILDRALQKDPALRYQSAHDFADALDLVQERLAKADSEQRVRATPTPATGSKPSPVPLAKGSKADVAYQRCQNAYGDGAVEAAKRFAVEALVEDPGHDAARAFLKKVDPQRRVPPPPPKRGPEPPTQVARHADAPRTEVVASDAEATLVVPHGTLSEGWNTPSTEGSTEDWDPYSRTVVVQPGQAPGGAAWPGGTQVGGGSEDAGLAPLIGDHDESGGWDLPRSEADPYERTIIAPATARPRSRQKSGRAQPARRAPSPLPWGIVAWIAVAVVAVGAAATATWYLLFRENDGVRLTIEKPEGGTITAGSLVCGTRGNDCAGAFDLESLIEFEAAPDEGFRLTGFTGDCAPGGRTRMTGPRSCGATFEKVPEIPPVPRVRLTVSKATGGTVVGSGINCGTGGNDCSVEYEVGSVVTLTASADEGFRFRGFAQDCGTGSTFSAAIQRSLDCAARFEGRPLKTPKVGSDPPNGGPSPGGVLPGGPTGRNADGPRGAGGGEGGGGPGSGARPGTGTPISGGSDPNRGGTVEKRDTVPPPKTPEEYAKEREEEAKKREEQARSSIEKTLEALPPAYEGLDFPAIQRLFPTAPTNIENQFRQYEELEYSYLGKPEFKTLDAEAGRAVVAIDVKQVITPKAGRKQEGEYRVTFEMYRREETWLISGSQFARKK